MDPHDAALDDRMAPVDAFIYRYENDPHTRSVGMSVNILDRPPDWERLLHTMDRLSRLLPRYRQRVIAPSLPIGLPRWVVDPDFDLSYHVRRIQLPGPGTMEQLLELCAPVIMAPLDVNRPLWEMTVVEGLEGGKAAVLRKASHSIVDGVGAVQVDKLFWSDQRDAPNEALPAEPTPRRLSANALTIENLVRAPGRTVSTAVHGAGRLLGLGHEALSSPGSALKGTVEYVGSISRMLGPTEGEPSPLLRRRSLGRRQTLLDLAMDDLRRSAKEAGGSLNDAYLAVLTGAMRIYHERMGVPIETITMGMPVNLRSEDSPAGGNHWSGIRFAAPVATADPRERIAQLRRIVLARRQEPAMGAFDGLTSALVRLPGPLLGSLMSSSNPTADIQASNIPGYTKTLYLGGAKLERSFPFGPVPGTAIMSVMFTMAGRCCFGINYDTASVTDSVLFDEALREGADEVLAIAGRTSAPSPATSSSGTSASKSDNTSASEVAAP